MPLEVSKAKQIMWHLGRGMRPSDVAREVGVSPEYVGIVRRRYASGKQRTEADTRWEAKHIDEIRAAARERVKKWKQANREKARAANKRWREKARERA